MKTLTKLDIESKIYETVLADKKYLTYTQITLVLLTQIGKPNIYVVRRKMQSILTTYNIDEAIERYNKYSN